MAKNPTGGNTTPPVGPEGTKPGSTPPEGANVTAVAGRGDTDATLVIPTLSSADAAAIMGSGSGPVLQDGENEEAVLASAPPPPAAAPRIEGIGKGVMAQAAMGTQSLAAAPPSRALDRPVIARTDHEVNEPGPETYRELQLSDIDKRLEDLRRSDLDLTPADPLGFRDHAALLAFMNEYVIINVHETNDEGAEDPLPLSVNGKTILLKRGVDMICRRYYVELLMRMKPQGIKTRIDRSDPDNIKNFIEKRSSLMHPFSIVRDDNPKWRAWVKKITSEV